MSGRIPPDRPGYSGYACDCASDPDSPECGIPLYVVKCMCCEGETDCEEGYYDIPTRLALSTRCAPWEPYAPDYLSAVEQVPDTDNTIWSTTPGITPNDCSDDIPPRYNFLETEYIDVPPISTRGVSFFPEHSVNSPVCSRCYEIERNSDGEIIKVFWMTSGNSPQGVAPDSDGGFPPTEKKLYEVSSSYSCEADMSGVVFHFCARDMAPYKHPDCSAAEYITIEAPLSPGESYRIKFDFEHISGYSSSGKYGLIIDDGCLKWLKMDDCPDT